MDVPSSALEAFAEPEANAEVAVAGVARVLASFVAEVVDGCGVSVVTGDQRGSWHVISASSDAARELTVAQLVSGSGPCLDVLRTRVPLLVDDLGCPSRHPALARAALARDVSSALVVPLSVGHATIGALCVFGGAAVSFARRRAHVQALAELAAVALSRGDAAIRTQRSVDELERALAARIAIEQAKGMLVEQAHIDLPAAFSFLLRHTRERGMALEDLARDVVAGRVSLGEELDAPRAPSGRGHRPPRAALAARGMARAPSLVPR